MARYRVIFRACEVVSAYNQAPRPFGLDKRTLIELCFASLMHELEGREVRIHVVGDRLSDGLCAFFRRFDVSLSNQTLDNSLSLREAFRIAQEADGDEWVYLCEDDYLHARGWLAAVDDLIEHRGDYLAYEPRPRWRRLRVSGLERKPLCIHLPDYPDLYRPKYRRPALVFHSRHCHWRQVTTTTGSFIARADYLHHKRAALDRFAATIDDVAMSRELYGSFWFRDRALCVSPIPGLATHMHEGTMSPLGDWEKLAHAWRTRVADPALRG